jgi:hypothetical protein
LRLLVRRLGTIYYLYEWHLGDYYIENHELPYDELYCSSCSDSDELIGSFKNEHELKQLLEKEGVFDEYIETIVRKWKAEE